MYFDSGDAQTPLLRSCVGWVGACATKLLHQAAASGLVLILGLGHVPAELLKKLREAEKAAGVEPDWAVDAFLKAATVSGQPNSVVTEFIVHMLGLGICADTIVGNAMRRGVSGGQKKRVTTGLTLPDMHQLAAPQNSVRPLLTALARRDVELLPKYRQHTCQIIPARCSPALPASILQLEQLVPMEHHMH